MVSKYDDALKENETLKARVQMMGEGVGGSSSAGEGGASLQVGKGVEGWEEDKRRLEAECLGLKKQVEDLRKEISDSSSDQQLEGDVIQRLQEENIQLKDTLEVLRAQCASSEEAVTRLSALQEENTRIQLMVKEEAQGAQDARKQVSKLKTELDGKVHELASVNADLVRCQATMERELAEMKHEKETLLTENAELRSLSRNPSHYQELKGENVELKESKEKLSASLEKERQMNAQLKEKSRELQQQLTMATDKERLMAVQRKVQEYKRERDQLRSENEKLQHRMQGLQHTQDLIQGHLVQFNSVQQSMERYKEELGQAQLEKDQLAEENARIRRLYQEHCGEIPPLLAHSLELEDRDEESASEPDVVAMETTEGADIGEWKPLDDEEVEDVAAADDSSGKGKGGEVKVGPVQEKLEQGAARPKSPVGPQPGTSPKIEHRVGNAEGSDVPPSQPNVVTVKTEGRSISCAYLNKGQSEKLGCQVLVTRKSGYDWGRLRYLPGVKDKEDFAGIELSTPSKPLDRVLVDQSSLYKRQALWGSRVHCTKGWLSRGQGLLYKRQALWGSRFTVQKAGSLGVIVHCTKGRLSGGQGSLYKRLAL